MPGKGSARTNLSSGWIRSWWMGGPFSNMKRWLSNAQFHGDQDEENPACSLRQKTPMRSSERLRSVAAPPLYGMDGNDQVSGCGDLSDEDGAYPVLARVGRGVLLSWGGYGLAGPARGHLLLQSCGCACGRGRRSEPPRVSVRVSDSAGLQHAAVLPQLSCILRSLAASRLDRNANASDLRILRSAQNRGIAAATNSGIAAARAPWVGFVDHDDALAPFALDRIHRALSDRPECQFLYTDEVVTDARLRPDAFFLKPAFDPVLLSGVNYINHLSLYRRERLVALGGLREGFNGSQDYDLLLRYTHDLDSAECLHLPYPAYLWRRDGATLTALFYANAVANARRALAEAYDAPVGAAPGSLHRIRFDERERDWPLVSVIIPNRDSFALIAKVLEGLCRKTDYPRLEIIISDNGTMDNKVLELYEQCRRGPVPFQAVIEVEPFNFARAINKGIARARAVSDQFVSYPQ